MQSTLNIKFSNVWFRNQAAKQFKKKIQQKKEHELKQLYF